MSGSKVATAPDRETYERLPNLSEVLSEADVVGPLPVIDEWWSLFGPGPWLR